MTYKAEELTKDIEQLVSLPNVCSRINAMMEDPLCTAADISEVISLDTAITAKVLQVANSPIYGFPSRIDTVSRAVTVIGHRDLHDLTLAASAVKAFSKIPRSVTNMGSFWRHSVFTGVVAQLLARRRSVLHSERLFIAGLMHDIGSLIINIKKPKLAIKSIERAVATGEELYKVEREIIGCDHAEVGAALLKKWKFPDSLQEAIGFHHEPQKATKYFLEAAIVHQATIISDMADIKGNNGTPIQAFDEKTKQFTQLNEDVIERVMDDARPEFIEAMTLFLPEVYQLS